MKQPAVKNYFFGDAYGDLWRTIAESWASNDESAKECFNKPGGTFATPFNWGMGISVYVFGTALFVACSAVHVTVLLSVALVVYAAYSLLWLLDAGYRRWRRIFTACPHCYAKSILPVYHCPRCNAKHDRLYPSSYGIFMRRCECGEKIPTVFFNGRSKLPATCPSCESSIMSEEARPVAIPIVGAPSVGKTFFVFSMVWSVREDFAVRRHLDFEFMNDYNKHLYEQQIERLNSGVILGKTPENNPVALNIFLSDEKKGSGGKDSKMGKNRSLLYLYDSAGEAFSSTQHLVAHKFYDYFSALIFIIDPFSIPEVYSRYEDGLAAAGVSPSLTPVEDVYDALIVNMEKNYNIKVTERISKPVAVVFSKTALFDLPERFAGPTRDDADEACRRFLRENGEESLLRKMEWKFANARYFAVNSGGQNSTGVDAVTGWLLGEINRDWR